MSSDSDHLRNAEIVGMEPVALVHLREALDDCAKSFEKRERSTIAVLANSRRRHVAVQWAKESLHRLFTAEQLRALYFVTGDILGEPKELSDGR